MGLLCKIEKEIRCGFTFGPGYTLRDWLKRFGVKRARLSLKGLGPAWFRPGDSDAATFVQIFYEKQYDLKKTPQAKRLRERYEAMLAAGRTPVIIDAGANVGAAALWFSRTYPRAVVVAIEPDPANFALMALNAQGREGIVLVEGALGAAPGAVVLSNPKTSSWAVQTTRVEDSEPGSVRVYDTGELLAMGGPNAELLIYKIDIEGFEKDLFAAHTGWLASTFALMIELHDWMLPGGGSSQPLQAAVLDQGFEMLMSGENLVLVRP